MTSYECPQCRGAGEYAYPGDGLRTTRCAKCKGTGFVDFPPLAPCPVVRRDPDNPRESYRAWDLAAEALGVAIGEWAYVAVGRQRLGFDRPPGPARVPSTRCASGMRPYCTCDLCF